jgi:hypothetical protein
MGGGKGGSSKPAASPYEKVLANIAQTEYQRAAPLRDAYMGQFQQLLGGTFDPKTSPLYSALYDSLRSSAGAGEAQARDQILSSTARGGGQTAALADLYRTSAKERSGAEYQTSSAILTDLLNQMYATSSGSPQAAIQGLSAAGNLANSNLMAQTQADALASKQGANLGGSLGMLGGLGLAASGVLPGAGIVPYALGALGGSSVGSGIGGKK